MADFDFYDDDIMADSPVKPKSKPKPKSTLANKENKENNAWNAKDDVPEKKKSSKKGKKTIEEIYQKKTQLEHILLRPDSYIGSIEKLTEYQWVYDEDKGLNYRSITYVPGLYKIFDEILVNAADNRQRDPNMNMLKIEINSEKNRISIWNNGKGIPIQMHQKEKVYVPELIFGHLLTSSNYDDNEKKVTGGRNGYGAKLCNIFSTEFVVETGDKGTGMKYKQVFRNNMGTKSDPDITQPKSVDDYTCITFKPDLGRFKMDSLDKDIIALFTKRAYDMAGVLKGVKVTLNGQRLHCRNFKEYIEMYLKANTEEKMPVVHEVVNDRWEVCITHSDGQAQQISFVNGIATTKGGTHVLYVADQVVAKIMEVVNKKNKAAPVKPFQLWIFVNCLVENPTFDSQTKENMTLRKGAFGSECNLSDKFINGVVKSGVVEKILNWAKFKQESVLAKATGGQKKSRLSGIPKLDDANMAGTKDSRKCTLILTEGDSAKALAVSGLEVVGRDHYGVFPLRGKLLNVREASLKQIQENQEIQNIVKILGLQFGKQYTSVDSLRYGSLMIMTDQDHDGSHIKGLLINFISHFWPTLLKMPGFLVEFITPIVKVTKGNVTHAFYTIPEYEAWKESTANVKNWRIKYYKGLGTSTPKEAKEYFAQMERNQIEFEWLDKSDDEKIELAFSKKMADARKDWLIAHRPGTYLENNGERLRYADFIDKELVLFSLADNARSIPSMVDGFKPGQRKILFSCFKRKLKDEIKVAQLAGYVSEHSSYHHGEQSLCATIVNMAQNFVGSNNINVLSPVGQFGTRIQGGKDAASARYIFTKLPAITRALFHIDDDPLLSYLNDDGQSIEPDYYVPVIPMVLVNGSDGIGTGWSSSVPNYNPRDLIANIRRLIAGEPLAQMDPWYKGFNGVIEEEKPSKYRVCGRITKINDTTLDITELPLKKWTQDYKEFLEELMQGTEKNPAFIKDYKEYHTDTTVHFTVTLSEDKMREAEEQGLEKKFKLTSSISTTNMVLFDDQGRIKKYDSPNEILEDFYALRLNLYKKRKSFLADRLTEEYERLDNKVRFIRAIISGDIVINNKKKAVIMETLKAKGYKQFPKNGKQPDEENAEENDEDESGGAILAGGYDYLLSMPLWSLTMEKVSQLESERDGKERELDILLKKSPHDLWNEDLEDLLQALDAEEQQEAAERAAAAGIKRKGKAGKGKPAARARQGSDFDDDDDWAPKKTAPKKTTIPAAKKPAAPKPAPAPAPKPTVSAPKPTVSAPKSSFAAKKASPPPRKTITIDSDSDDAPTLSLSERLKLQSKPLQSKPAAAPKKKIVSSSDSEDDAAQALTDRLLNREKANKRSPSPSSQDSSDAPTKKAKPAQKSITSFMQPVGKPKAAAKAAPKAKPAKKKVVISDDDISEQTESSASEDESDYAPSPKPKKKAIPAAANKAKAAPKPKPAKAAAAPMAKRRVSSDEDDDAAANDSNLSDAMGDVQPRGPRNARARAQVKYSFSDSDEESAEESDYAPSD